MSFPVSPVNGQITTVNNTTYVYNSTNKSWTRSVGVSGTANVTTVNATTVNTVNGVFYSNGVVYGPNYTASTTTPANAKVNDRWYYTPTDTVYEYIFDGNNTQWVDVTGQTINNLGTTNSVSGNLTVFGNIVPGANVTYTLGTPTARFTSLYLSGNTIDLGGAVMKTDATTGAIALIPLPTAANPNPTGIVVSPTGSISTVATTGGNLTANSISNASNVASASGTSLTNLVVANTVSLTTQLTTTAVTASAGTLNVGGNVSYGPDYGLMASFVANIPNYAYVAAQNLNTGGNASTSFTAYNNTGTSYIDVGVNSSNFNAVSSGYVNNSVNAPNSSYVYSYGGDMVVGTWGNNGIHFITNATNTVGDSMFISGNGNVYISGNLTVSGNTTQINTITTILTEQANALQVSYITGNVATASGNINVANPLIVGNTFTVTGNTSYTGTTNYFSGNLGISTTTPNRPLEVYNSSQAPSLRLSNSGGNQGIELVSNGGFVNWLLGSQYHTGNTFEITPSASINSTTWTTPVVNVTSTGNVGIGTTNPVTPLHITVNNGNPYNTVQNVLTLQQGGGNQGSGAQINFVQGGSTNWIQSLVTGANYNSGSALLFGTASGSGVATETMRITSTGQLTLGSSFGTARFSATQTSADAYGIVIQASSGDRWLRMGHNGTVAVLESTYNSSSGNSPISFQITSSEKMRIDTSGTILAGTTSAIGGTSTGYQTHGVLSTSATVNSGPFYDPSYSTSAGIPYFGGNWASAGNWGIGTYSGTSDNSLLFQEISNGTGGFYFTGNYATLRAAAFTPVSDYRLKSNVVNLEDGILDKLMQLRPVRYNLPSIKDKKGNIVSTPYEIGFIAHEVQAVFPEHVAGVKDEVHKNGTPKHQGINYEKMTATLTKAIQELNLLVTAQANTIATLQTTVTALQAKVGI